MTVTRAGLALAFARVEAAKVGRASLDDTGRFLILLSNRVSEPVITAIGQRLRVRALKRRRRARAPRLAEQGAKLSAVGSVVEPTERIS